MLQAAPALVTVLKGVELALAPPGTVRGPQARRDVAAFADLVPFLTDQAQEWAATACATFDTSAPLPVRLSLRHVLQAVEVVSHAEGNAIAVH